MKPQSQTTRDTHSFTTPYERASLISKLFFFYIYPVLRLANQRNKNQDSLHCTFLHYINLVEDIYELKTNQQCKHIINKFNKYFTQTNSVRKALYKSIGWMGIIMLFMYIVGNLLKYASPILLERILLYFENDSNNKSDGYIYAGLLVGIILIRIMFLQHGESLMNKAKLVTVPSILGLIFEKVLKISLAAEREIGSGKIINIFTIDSMSVGGFIMFFPMLFTVPLNIVICISMIYIQIGWIGLIGVGVAVLSLLLQQKIMRTIRSYRKLKLQASDNKTKLISEYISAIRIIKLNAWENYAFDEIKKARQNEINLIFKERIYWKLYHTVMITIPNILIFAVISVYVLMGNDLKPSKVYTLISLFNLLTFPLNMLTSLILNWIQVKVSLERIRLFMQSHQNSTIHNTNQNIQNGHIIFKKASFAWTNQTIINHAQLLNILLKPKIKKQTKHNQIHSNFVSQSSQNDKLIPNQFQSTKDILSDLDFDIKPGMHIGIAGEIGSGKTALATSIIHEMIQTNGHLIFKGSFRYAPQQPWIFNGTLRENIIIGSDFIPERFEEVVKICELESDIELLEKKDLTEIGTKGINLSGGQKQRVSIARAIYTEGDIYIMDDIFSALDSYVGQNIFQNVIQQFLKNKTIVLISHSLYFFEFCHQIIVLQNGLISQIGTYQELIQQNGQFQRLLQTNHPDFSNNQHPTEKVKHNKQREISSKSTFKDKKEKKPDENNANNNLIQKEKIEVGKIKCRLYYKIMKYGGRILILVIILTYLISQFMNVGLQYLLGIWALNEEDRSNSYYMLFYGGICIGSIFLTLFREILFVFFSIQISKKTQLQMIDHLLKSPLWWFDITPTGRIINRCSKDQQVVDMELSRAMSQALNLTFRIFVSVIVVEMITPYFVIILVFLFPLYLFYYKTYIQAARDTRRLWSASKSPIFSFFGETLDGLAVIRSTKLEECMRDKIMRAIDDTNKASYMNALIRIWMNLRFEFLGAVVVATATFLVIFLRDSLDANLAGLCIVQSLEISNRFKQMLNAIGEYELKMAAFERIIEYAEELPSEKHFHHPKPPIGWPHQGNIIFHNVWYKYRPELKYVIKGISFQVKSQEKIGITGRTGSGKSTLILGLLRIIETSQEKDGYIEIDGVRIDQIGLHELRKKIAIIPQDPVIFSGTLKSNIDPFDIYSVDDYEEVLSKTNLIQIIQQKLTQTKYENFSQILQFPIQEGGNNLSLGERQLICLARAIIRSPKIIIMDEATASIDLATDTQLQKMIQLEFKEKTVLTIAHRINTISHYTKILLLDEGIIADFDTPKNVFTRNNEIIKLDSHN